MLNSVPVDNKGEELEYEEDEASDDGEEDLLSTQR